MPTEARRCIGIKADGSGCKAAPLSEGDHCLMHSPQHAEEVAEARRLGGLRRRREITVQSVYDLNGLDSIEEIRRLLQIAAIEGLSLENSVARVRTLVYLASVSLRTHEVTELEDRVANQERLVKGNG